MTKVELAKMLGLTPDYTLSVDKWQIKDLLEDQWYHAIECEFNAGVKVEVLKEDVENRHLDFDNTLFLNYVEELLWERAADKYLEKIKDIVNTIKV